MAAAVECPNCGCHCAVPSGPGRARIDCPNCASTFTFQVTKTVTLAPVSAQSRGGAPVIAPSDRRIARRGHVLRLRCPHCESLVDLCRRERKKGSRPKVVGAVATPAGPAEPEAYSPPIEEPEPEAPAPREAEPAAT